MLENLSETSEDVTSVFYKSEEEESVKDQTETVDDDSEAEDDLEGLADEETEDTEEDENLAESGTIFGKEITREEFDTMKDQQLMHADYTKKTQATAVEREKIEGLNSDLTATIVELEALIVSEESNEELLELKEDDYVEYLRRKELIDSKKSKLKGAKSRQADALKVTQTDENQKLISVMPEWADTKNGAATQKSDVDTALKYAGEIGYSNDDLNKLADHKVIRALIDAGKYRELKKSKPAQSKRKTTASKKVSGKKVASKKQLTPSELFYGVK